MKKVITGFLAALVVYFVPAYLVNPSYFINPHLWVLLVIIVAASVTQPAYSPLDREAPPEDRGTAKQIVWSVYLTQLLGSLEAVLWRGEAAFTWDWISTFALSLSVGGLVFRAWAVQELGRFFTWHVRVADGQRVITSGPFRFVRHPSYAGAVLLYVGLLVIIHAWFSAITALALMIIAFTRRINYEEKHLREHLGEEYNIYSQSVKRLIPSLW